MHRYLSLLLFIGLAWGQNESDTTQIDYIKMGIDAANEDFNPTLSYMTGCSGLGFFFIPLNAIARDVKIPKKHNQILASNGGEQFRKGYKKGLIDSRIKNLNKGLKHYLIGAGGLSCYLFLGLTLDFSGFILFN
tara:strand:- start:472 stop:873 length:402 start_codon:yes stop_codon:yes gene_type:complete